MEDIAATAGIAVGTVYNYFEDRRALVGALLETRTKGLLGALDAPAPPLPGAGTPRGRKNARETFEAELAHFVTTLAAHFDANRFLLRVLVEEEQHRGVDARSATRRRSALDSLMGRAETLMAAGLRARVLRRDDAATYAALLVGMIRGVAREALRRRHEFAAGDAASIVRVFLNGAAR